MSINAYDQLKADIYDSRYLVGVSVPVVYVMGVAHLGAVVYITDKLNIDRAGAGK